MDSQSSRGQALVEMALTLPLFIALVFGCLDLLRYIYISSVLTDNSVNAARTAALANNQTTDCNVQRVAETDPGIFTAPSPDPAAVYGNTLATVPSTPAAGAGYVYIYPAVATSSTTCGNSVNRPGTASPPSSVTVRITYQFQPVTPLLPAFPIVAVSTQPTGY
jgi:Flp pilus assembly protein TadG